MFAPFPDGIFVCTLFLSSFSLRAEYLKFCTHPLDPHTSLIRRVPGSDTIMNCACALDILPSIALKVDFSSMSLTTPTERFTSASTTVTGETHRLEYSLRNTKQSSMSETPSNSTERVSQTYLHFYDHLYSTLVFHNQYCVTVIFRSTIIQRLLPAGPKLHVCPTTQLFSMLCLFVESSVSVLHHPVHEFLSRPSSSSRPLHASLHYRFL